MSRTMLRKLLCLVALALSGVLTTLQAQTTTFVSPVPFYRFRVSNTNLGFLYTASFQEGVNAGFTPHGANGSSSGVIGFIVVPPTQDSTPVAGQGLQALHRWRVIESGRAYWYLSPFFSTHGSNYTYEGIAGYTFNLNDTTHFGLVLTAFYSQKYGYFFSLDGERLPDASFDFGPFGPVPSGCEFIYTNPANGLSYCSSYRNHGSICKLLQNNFGSFAFTTPAPPPPPPPPPDDGGNTCSAGLALKSKCSQLGGSWNDETCSCEQ